MKRLSESIWGDIRKKSLGQEERQEDDISNLSIKEFSKYLELMYTLDSSVNKRMAEIGASDDCIFFPAYKMSNTLLGRFDIHLSAPNEIKYVSISNVDWFKKNSFFNDFEEALGDDFEYDENLCRIVPKKDSTFTYEEFLNLFDRLLGIIKRPVRYKKIDNEKSIFDIDN